MRGEIFATLGKKAGSIEFDLFRSFRAKYGEYGRALKSRFEWFVLQVQGQSQTNVLDDPKVDR